MTRDAFPRRRLGGLSLGLAGLVLFGFFGNESRGYIKTASLFHWWTFQWVNPDSETQHAWLVLALSIGLFIWNWRRFGAKIAQAGGARSSLAALALALLLHALAYRAEQPRVSVIALLLFGWGAIGLLGGKSARDAATFPIALMVFAIPINALDTLGFWLRLAVVHAGAGLAHFLGIAVIRSGTQLFSPDGRYQYDVAAACSGIRSLQAFFALTVFLGYVQLRTFLARSLLVVSCVPLIVLGNVARILSIVVGASMGGQSLGERVHDVMGYVVFVIVIGGVIIVAYFLEGRRLNGPAAGPAVGPGSRTTPATRVEQWGTWWAAGLTAACIGILSGSSASAGQAGVVLTADGLAPAPLPAFVGSNWMGREIPTSAAELAVLPKDTGFAKRLYFDLNSTDQRRRVLFSVVLSGTDRTSIHRPELCLIGQGWSIDDTSTGTLGSGSSRIGCTILRVHRDLITPKGVVRAPELVAYCFVGHEKTAGSYPGLLAADAWNRVAHGQADRWAYLLLQTGAAEGQEAALQRIQAIFDGVSANLFGHPPGR